MPEEVEASTISHPLFLRGGSEIVLQICSEKGAGEARVQRCLYYGVKAWRKNPDAAAAIHQAAVGGNCELGAVSDLMTSLLQD